MGGIVNAIWDKLTDALEWVVNLLPDSPFVAISNTGVAQSIRYLNWALPISEALVIMEAWTTAIAIFYIYQAVLRWIKAIE